MAFVKLNEEEFAALTPAKQASYLKEAAANEAATSKTLVELKDPKISTLHGSVVNISEWRKGSDEEGATFKHDTRIVTVSDLKDGSTHDVFITRNQWKEYGCEAVLYNGNAVTLSLEEAIKGITGYKDSKTSEVLTAHTKSFKAFNKVVFLDDINFMAVLEERGLSFNSIDMLLNTLIKKRGIHDEQVQKSATATPLF
jgi:hypothetical protein